MEKQFFRRILSFGFTNSFHFTVYRIPLLLLYLTYPLPHACGKQSARLRRAIRAGGVPPPGLLQSAAAPAPAAPRRAPLDGKPALRPCGKTAAQEFAPCACGKQSARLRRAIRAGGVPPPGLLQFTALPAPATPRRAPLAGKPALRPCGKTAAQEFASCACGRQSTRLRRAIRAGGVPPPGLLQSAAALRKNGSAGICFLRRTLKPVCLQPRHRAAEIRMCEKSPGFWGNCDYYIILEDKVP